MRHIGHPPPPPNENVTLSYPHKTYWRRLTKVWYGSFTGRETQIYSSLTVWRQSIDNQWYEVCKIKHGRIYMSVYMSVCGSVCESVCLSIKMFIALGQWLRHCLGLNITFSETSQSQSNPNWSTQRKYVVVTLDQTGNSGGKGVCPVFQGIWTWAKKNWLHVCLSATSLLSSLLKTWLLSL